MKVSDSIDRQPAFGGLVRLKRETSMPRLMHDKSWKIRFVDLMPDGAQATERRQGGPDAVASLMSACNCLAERCSISPWSSRRNSLLSQLSTDVR